MPSSILAPLLIPGKENSLIHFRQNSYQIISSIFRSNFESKKPSSKTSISLNQKSFQSEKMSFLKMVWISLKKLSRTNSTSIQPFPKYCSSMSSCSQKRELIKVDYLRSFCAFSYPIFSKLKMTCFWSMLSHKRFILAPIWFLMKRRRSCWKSSEFCSAWVLSTASPFSSQLTSY